MSDSSLNPRSRSRLITVDQPKQLLVEGRSAVEFFAAVLRNIQIADIQLQNFGGIDDLRKFLKAFRALPSFQEGVVSVGIVRDAETDPKAAFASICGALAGATLAVPQQPELLTGGKPQVAALILPDAATPGMLETLCLRSVSDDPVIQCIEQYFTCVEGVNPLPSNIPKAHFQAFLASRPTPGLLLGQAAQRGYLPWDNPAFQHVKDFLRSL